MTAFSPFFTASALASIPTGHGAERLGAARAARCAAALAATSMMGIALRPTSVIVLGALLLPGAAANAMAQATANLLLAAVGVPSAWQGLAFGIKQSAVPLAVAFGGAAVPIIGTSLGWHGGFAGGSALAVLVAAFVPHAALGRVAEAPQGYREPSDNTELQASAHTRICYCLRQRGHGMLWTTRSGMGVGEAGTLLSVAGLGSVATRVVNGLVADRRAGRNMGVVIDRVLVGVVGLTLVATGNVPFIIIGAMLTISLSWSWPGLLLLMVVGSHPGSPASASGVVQMGAYTGNAVGPGLFGLLITLTTFRTGWLIITGLLIVTAMLRLIHSVQVGAIGRRGEVAP